MDIDIDNILEKVKDKEQCSALGFFSKPYKINTNIGEVIVKIYHPLKSGASLIIDLHEEYVAALRNTGVQFPETRIASKKIKDKEVLVIVQEAFKEEELVRTIFEKQPIEELLPLLKLMFDDTIQFWKNKPKNTNLGFHPTLRNYAFSGGSLHYFDSFPPMNLSQKALNKLLIKLAPVSSWVKPFVPSSAMNRVSDEYYSVEKMITGIIGSSIRLRAEHTEAILAFCKDYIAQAALKPEEKKNIIETISSPPKLSSIWLFVRKITGNVGKPNVNT